MKIALAQVNPTVGDLHGNRLLVEDAAAKAAEAGAELVVLPEMVLTGYPPMDKTEWIRLLKIARSYGLNHCRFHSWFPPEAALEAADELGMYLAPELIGERRGSLPATIDEPLSCPHQIRAAVHIARAELPWMSQD